eukprot:scaffold63452_cov65-Phaeocystis_antarctica.AAC.7
MGSASCATVASACSLRVWYSLWLGLGQACAPCQPQAEWAWPFPFRQAVGALCAAWDAVPLLARVELLGQRVVLTSLEVVAVVERPRRDGTGSRRAAVEEAALMRTSHASDESCQPWRCQPGPDHAAAFR